jgi:hypothetical protein
MKWRKVLALLDWIYSASKLNVLLSSYNVAMPFLLQWIIPTLQDTAFSPQ